VDRTTGQASGGLQQRDEAMTIEPWWKQLGTERN
jgi:hypothetical protein